MTAKTITLTGIFMLIAILVGTVGDARAQTGSDPSPTVSETLLTTPEATAEVPETLPPAPEIIPFTESPITATLTSTPTPLLSAGLVLTATGTITATATITPTATLTPTIAPTPTNPVIYLPYINVQPTPSPTSTPTQDPTPPERILVCRNPNFGIPDNNAAGVSDIFVLSDGRYIHDLDVQLKINHSWVSDLAVSIQHLDSGRRATLVDRPMYPANAAGCGKNDVDTILDDDMTLSVEDQCYESGTTPAVAGMYRPQERLSTFDGDSLAGVWQITVADLAQYDYGEFNGWCISALVGNTPPTPTPPPVFDLPRQARVYNVPSVHQALPLDCESRVAVDWARFFGYYIDEIEFFRQLPHSDNPDVGFVGSVYGDWGQIPPNSYGVHAEPVAEVLGDYGVTAYAQRPLSWDALRNEIASGRPVYVWTIGSGISRGIPVYYTSQDGHTSIVARYEHTIMVVGYSDTTVTILDGGVLATRSLDEFLGSWSALGQMAITAVDYSSE